MIRSSLLYRSSKYNGNLLIGQTLVFQKAHKPEDSKIRKHGFRLILLTEPSGATVLAGCLDPVINKLFRFSVIKL